MNNQITKKDLSIFRGTYNECMTQPSEDMKFYLAWDTQEIFVGNAVGQKVLYGVSKSLFRYIDENFEDIKLEIERRLKNIETDFEEYIKEYTGSSIEEIVIAEPNKVLDGVVDEINKTNIRLDKIDSTNGAIADIESRVSSLESTPVVASSTNLIYLTGDDMRLIEDIKEKYREEISKNNGFLLIFCTEKTKMSGKKYSANSLYYFYDDEIHVLEKGVISEED